MSSSVRDFRDRLNPGEPVTVFYTYEPTGANPHPTSVTDGNGNTTEYRWDRHGNLLGVSDPTGVHTTYTYNERQELTSVTNGAGDTTHLDYDAHGRPIKVRDPLGRVTTMSWNAAGQLASLTDAAGSRWTLTYPEHTPEELDVPALVRQRLAGTDAESARGTSRPQGQLPSSLTDPYGHITRFEYNNGNQLTAVTDPLGRTERAVFDTWGNMVQTINALGAVTGYEYDGLSQLTAVIDPLGARSEFEYDLAGELTTITDATGVTTRHTVNRKTGEENSSVAGMFTSSFRKIDHLGRVTYEGEKNNAPRSAFSSPDLADEQAQAVGRLTRSYEGATAEFITYDAASKPLEIIDAHGGLTRRSYDAANRLIREISAAGRTQTFEYDRAGRLWRMGVGLSVPERKPAADENADWEEPTAWAYTTLTYDAASQVVAREYPDGTVERITYDALGRIVRISHGARTATYAYDRCSRLVRMSDNGTGTRRFIYDAAGQLVTVADALGYRTHFEYDAAGQMTRTVDATGQVTEYSYDAAGQLIRTVKGAGSSTEITTAYTYDAAGRLLSEDYGERSRSYSYDYRGGGLLSSLSVDGVCAAEYSYSPGASTVGHRTVTVRDYAAARAIIENDPSAFADVELPYLEHRFVYDASDRLISRSRSGFTGPTERDTTSAEGELNERLHALNTFIKTGAYTLTYSYDADGYLITSVSPYAESVRTVDGAGRTVAVTTHATGQPADRATASAFSYDPLGRLTRIQVGDLVSSWTHDHATGLITDYVRKRIPSGASGAEGTTVLEHTQVTRDSRGRVVGLDSSGAESAADGLIMYSYDDAGQLTGARSETQTWEWDYVAGVMVRERIFTPNSSASGAGSRVLAGERIFTHNSVNQLVEVQTREYAVAGEPIGTVTAHTVTEYTYNLAGERTDEVMTDRLTGTVSSRHYRWGVYGGLASVTDSDSACEKAAGTRLSLISDVTGEVTAVSDGDRAPVPLLWDSRSHIPHLLGAGPLGAPSSDGGFSQAGIPGGITPWHTLNTPGMPDPAPGQPTDWGVPPATGSVPGLPAGFEFTGAGSLRAAGLDVLGARAYDPLSRRFLSTDPRPAVAGSSWFADVYAYAGNNPLEYVDPRGERPMTVEEYRKYQDQEGERFVQQSLRFLALTAGLAALIVAPQSILIGVGFGLLSGGLNGSADGMDNRDADGNLSWDSIRDKAAEEGGKEALFALIGGAIFKYGSRVLGFTGRQAMKIPGAAKSVNYVKNTPVYTRTRDGLKTARTRIDGIKGRVRNWARASLIGVEHTLPKLAHPQHTPPHPVDIPNGPTPPHTGSLDHTGPTPRSAHEPNAQLKPVEEPKIENLPSTGKGAGSAEGPQVSVRDVHTHLEENLEGVRRKEWRGKDKNGRPRTDYYNYDEYIDADNNYIKLKRKIKEYEADKKQAELEGKEFTKERPEDPGPRPQPALWKDAEERFAPDLSTSMQLDEVGLKHHRVVRIEDYEGQIPQETAEHLEKAVQKIVKEGSPPHYPGANEGRTFNNEPWKSEGEGKILPTTDVEGNAITYTEMDFMEPKPKIGQDGQVKMKPNGKPETTRGDDRLLVGSNGSIYYSPDHYHTFILLVE